VRRIQEGRLTSDDDWQAEFTTALANAGLAPLTVRTYRHNVALFLAWLGEVRGGTTKLSDLCAAEVLSYRQHLVSVARLRAATINQRLQAIRWLGRWAEHHGLLKSSPVVEVKSLPVPKRLRPVGLTEPEVHSLLRVAGESKREGKRNYALLQLLLQTGLQVGELASLRVADVTIRERSGEVRTRRGAGSKEREVPLNASGRRALRAYLKSRPEAQADDSLFLSNRGRVLSPRALQTLLQRLARRAKITRLRVTPLRLRHTFALNYLQQNPGKLVDLANLMGHESLDTTAVYTEPSGAEELAKNLERSRLNVHG